MGLSSPSRGLGGCGLVSAVFVGLWWCAGLCVTPLVGCQLGLMDGCGSGSVVVRGWTWSWFHLVGFSGWCSLLEWMGLVLGWVQVWFLGLVRGVGFWSGSASLGVWWVWSLDYQFFANFIPFFSSLQLFL